MLSSKLFNTFAICLVLTGPARSNLAGRITAARRESFRRVPPKGSSTKDDGGKHLRAVLAQVGDNHDMLFPGSNVPDFAVEDNSAMYVPKVTEQVELHDLFSLEQAQVIQALVQEGVAEMKATMAKMKAAHAEEMAKMKATIQAAHNEARRLGVSQELDDVIEEVAMIILDIEAVNATTQENAAAIGVNAGSIETVNATVQENTAGIEAVNSTVQENANDVQENAAGIEAVNSTIQALEAQLKDAIVDLNTSVFTLNDCCTNTTAALIRVDSDGDGVSDLDDGCPNDAALTLFGAVISDISQCETLSLTPSTSPSTSTEPSISTEPSLTPSLTPSLVPSLEPSETPSLTLTPTTECQRLITTNTTTGTVTCPSIGDGNCQFSSFLALKSAVDAYIACSDDLSDTVSVSCNQVAPFGPIGTWCTSGITDMRQMFFNQATFNDHVGSWDTSSVTNMQLMFRDASVFNQDISLWNVSSVTDMQYMFFLASVFNQNISLWNVGSVTNMKYMFFGASAFNQNLCEWKETPAVLNNQTNGMFLNCPGGEPKKYDSSFDASKC